MKPAVPVTVDGLVYAGAGMVLALLVYQGCVAAPCRALGRRWQNRKASKITPPKTGG